MNFHLVGKGSILYYVFLSPFSLLLTPPSKIKLKPYQVENTQIESHTKKVSTLLQNLKTREILVAQLVVYMNIHHIDKNSILHPVIISPPPNPKPKKENSNPIK